MQLIGGGGPSARCGCGTDRGHNQNFTDDPKLVSPFAQPEWIDDSMGMALA
jgi:hypothetical protein